MLTALPYSISRLQIIAELKKELGRVHSVHYGVRGAPTVDGLETQKISGMLFEPS